MSVDPFLIRAPDSLTEDPAAKEYFDFLGKVLSDLTTQRGDAIADPELTAPTDNEAALKSAIDAILAQMRFDGTIKT